MSDYLDSMNASDSGFLNAFVGPLQQPPTRGVASRVGGDMPLAGDAPTGDRADLDQLLRHTPVPHGLADRLRQFVDGL